MLDQLRVSLAPGFKFAGLDSNREQMEFKRRTEIFLETKKQRVIQQPELPEPVFCPECGQAMLTAESAAALFGVNRRAIYRLVETKTAHFSETENGLVLLCWSSLEAVFASSQPKQLPAPEEE